MGVTAKLALQKEDLARAAMCAAMDSYAAAKATARLVLLQLLAALAHKTSFRTHSIHKPKGLLFGKHYGTS
jgi:hypothetical protein